MSITTCFRPFTSILAILLHLFPIRPLEPKILIILLLWFLIAFVLLIKNRIYNFSAGHIEGCWCWMREKKGRWFRRKRVRERERVNKSNIYIIIRYTRVKLCIRAAKAMNTINFCWRYCWMCVETAWCFMHEYVNNTNK